MTGPIFQAINTYRSGVSTRLANQQNSGINSLSQGDENPAWVCDYRLGDVSYPMILNMSLPLYGSTGAQTAGTVHTHPNGGAASSSSYTLAQNNSFGAYVPITKLYQADKFSFCASVNSAMAGGSIDFELFRELADGSLIMVGTAAAVTSISTTFQRITLTSPDKLITRRGERVMMRLVNRSSPARTVTFQGIVGTADPGSPYAAFATVGTTTTNKTSYTSAEAATAQNANDILPWMLIACSTPPAEDKNFNDDFQNRVNIGPAWALTHLTTTDYLVISNGRLVYGGTTNGTEGATCIYPCSSDSMRVDVDVWNLASTSSGVAASICADREGNNFAVLELYQDRALLRSVIGATTTTRATYNSGTITDATWSLYFTPATKTYTALRNGDAVGLSWNDSGDLIPHGVNNRYGLLAIGRASGVNGGELDNYVLRDWAP